MLPGLAQLSGQLAFTQRMVWRWLESVASPSLGHPGFTVSCLEVEFPLPTFTAHPAVCEGPGLGLAPCPCALSTEARLSVLRLQQEAASA